jgi:aquaporin NIP
MKKLLAECLGTFFLVFAGAGAAVVNASTDGSLGPVGIALVFGLVVMAMIHTFGDVSGAHLNPAVTLGFAFARRFSWREVPGYTAAQILGGLAGGVTLALLFPSHHAAAMTLPSSGTMQSFVLEVLLSFFLMLTILSVSGGSKEKGLMAGLTIGSLIGLEALFAGPICGASMNPARSLGPALASLHLEHLWIYLTAPVLGALLAVPICVCVRQPGCCSPSPL